MCRPLIHNSCNHQLATCPLTLFRNHLNLVIYFLFLEKQNRTWNNTLKLRLFILIQEKERLYSILSHQSSKISTRFWVLLLIGCFLGLLGYLKRFTNKLKPLVSSSSSYSPSNSFDHHHQLYLSKSNKPDQIFQ